MMTVYCEQNKGQINKPVCSHPELLLLGQQVVVLVALVQRHQNVLQPVPHTQRELCQLTVQTGLDDCKTKAPSDTDSH